jgi:hypothetical protein
MKLSRLLFTLVLAAGWVYSASAAYIPLRSDVLDDRPQAHVLNNSATEVQLEILLPGLEIRDGILEGQRWDRLEIPGCGIDQEPGTPELPHFTRLLVVPPVSGFHAEFEALETVTIPNLHLMPAQPRELEELTASHTPVIYNAQIYAKDEFFPSQRVTIGPPALLRGMRVVALKTSPLQYNPITRELKVATRYRVTVHFEGTDLRNVPARQIPLSRTWVNSLSGAVFNLDATALDAQEVGSYLIVCENDATLQNYLAPLIDWKKRKGHAVTTQTFSSYQATTTTVKNLIQTAYNTWAIPPEYVLLVGDASVMGPSGYTLPAWPTNDQYGIDHPYSKLDGSDVLADVSLGRLPAGNSTEIQTIVNKILYYEKMPYTTSSDWFHQGAVLAGDVAAGFSTIQVGRWVKTRMIEHEYTRVDTFWYTMSGTVAQTVIPSINNGILFMNYRGNNGMEDFTWEDFDQLTNGRRLPFVVTITCHTGGFQSGYGKSLMEYFCDTGSPTSPRGAVAAIGTATLDTHTRQNNTVDMGIYAALYDEGITQAGNALNYGKLELYNTYFEHDPQSVEDFSDWNSLAGDPGLELFTQAIQFMTCSVPDQITFGVNSLSLNVTETGVGPLEGATVCLYKSGTPALQSVGTTDANGQVTLPLTVSATGNVKVTIHKQNFFPLVDSLNVVSATVAVGYQSHTVDDDNLNGTIGDNDDALNPGETVDLPLTFKNFGTSTTATGVSATASETDPFTSLSNTTQSFPDMAPGATANSSGALRLTIGSACPDGYMIPLAFNTTSGQGNWPGGLVLPVVSFNLTTLSKVAQGSDTLITPGETADFELTVKNVGHKTAMNLTATMTSLDPLVTVNDGSASFGTVALNGTVSCSTNPFNLTASSNAPVGIPVKLRVVFNANYATQVETLTVELGIKSATDPQGPDAYGYYCYDNTDVDYPEHPTFSWVEIDPTHGGSGTMVSLGDYAENEDVSALVTLPFTFRYYGQISNQITVCSNGWISMLPNVAFSDFRNYPIPTDLGPYAMIAPFWDDLMETLDGHVYQWNDPVNHRLIVEWSRLVHLTDSSHQIFEVILYDPAHYSTPTGDGVIVFQYDSIVSVFGMGDDNPYSTIGIENWDQNDGVETFYWNTYEDPAVAPLAAGRAYKYTTISPLSLPPPTLDVTLTPVNPPLTVPANGGSFQFNASVLNNGPTQAPFAAWARMKYPDGTYTAPTLGPVTINPPVSVTITRLRNQNVPGSYPPGLYTYVGYANPSFGYPAVDSSSFTFTKLTTADGGPEMTNAFCSGELFPGEQPQAAFLPSGFDLKVNPNPFNPSAAISYQLSAISHVSVKVYDTAGRLVTTLADGWQEAGSHQVTFDGSRLSSGLYFVKMQAGDFSGVQKLILLK